MYMCTIHIMLLPYQKPWSETIQQANMQLTCRSLHLVANGINFQSRWAQLEPQYSMYCEKKQDNKKPDLLFPHSKLHCRSPMFWPQTENPTLTQIHREVAKNTLTPLSPALPIPGMWLQMKWLVHKPCIIHSTM